MRYLPKSPSDRDCDAERNRRVFDRRFVCDHPRRVSPRPRSEDSTRRWASRKSSTCFRAAADRNANGYASFLGAGAYRHYRPVVIDALVQRGEFLTSYTPYQAEITQGTLQAIFEFQTMICELTGMEIANASMYDGSTGAAEAVMMAVRVTRREPQWWSPAPCIRNIARS